MVNISASAFKSWKAQVGAFLPKPGVLQGKIDERFFAHVHKYGIGLTLHDITREKRGCVAFSTIALNFTSVADLKPHLLESNR